MNRLPILVTLIAFALAACNNPSTNQSGLEQGPLEVTVDATGISKAAPFEVTFTATTTGALSDLSYTWDYGDLSDAVTAGPNPSRTYLHPGSYTVRVQASDGKTTASDSIVINVLEPHYYGNWIWVAEYPDASFYRGVLNITLAAEDGDGFTDTSIGVASFEYADGSAWDVPYGFGLIGTFTDSGMSALSTVITDGAAYPMLGGIDYDNRIGAEFNGDPSFYGEGVWINADGTQDAVYVGLRRDSKEPLFAPAPNYDPTMASTYALTTHTLGTSSQASPSTNADRLERMTSLVNGEGDSLPLP